MHERTFSRKCGKCRQRMVQIAVVPYEVQVDHDGRKYRVEIAALSVPKCSNCGTISIDVEADKQIDAAFREVAGLLKPEQIRAGREELGLNQQEFADVLGIAASTLSRWENGVQVQQRSLDRFVRAFFNVPALREHLMRPTVVGKPVERATQASVTVPTSYTPPVDIAVVGPYSFTSEATTTIGTMVGSH